MRKVDIKGVQDDFVDTVADIETAVQQIVVANLSQQTKAMVAEYSLLAAAVLWETFVSDLFIAHINRSSGQLGKTLQTRVRQSVESKHGKLAARFVSMTLPAHLRRDDVRLLVDQREFNLTFASTAEMVQRAPEYLPAAAATKLYSLKTTELASIDAWQAIRHFLAHRSRSSFHRMNHALESPFLDGGLRRGMHQVEKVGSFLSSIPSAMNKWRVLYFLDAMKAVAKHL